jgi:hypothetical protein
MPSLFRKVINNFFHRALVHLVFILFFSSLPIGINAFAESSNSREYIYKASYIYNFTSFIEWPEKARKKITQNGINLCLIGDDPFGAILDRTSEKLFRKGEILNIKRGITLDKLSQCSILFISSSEKPRLREIVRHARNFPVLLIGDTPGFARNGVGINFFIQEHNIHFEINEKAINNSGLNISSDLLDLGRIIEE